MQLLEASQPRGGRILQGDVQERRKQVFFSPLADCIRRTLKWLSIAAI
jgi:hypothetical protein